MKALARVSGKIGGRDTTFFFLKASPESYALKEHEGGLGAGGGGWE